MRTSFVWDKDVNEWVEASKVANPIMRSRRPRPARMGYYRISSSNGVPTHQVPQAMKVDHELGVPITYIPDGPISYAAYDSPQQSVDWLRAHKRVNHDPGYRDPVPGDFR